MAEFENVRTSIDLFRNERNHAYSNPGQASVREHLTNAADAILNSGRAASGRIDIEVLKLADNVTRLVVADNGIGMDENTIRNVFMVLGKTSKASTGGQGGGFGRARLLTHFSQHKYHIYTRDLHVIGKGDRFKVLPNPHGFTNGCVMEVYVENLDRWNSEINWVNEVYQFLSACQMPYTVTVNGERFTNWLHKGRIGKTLSIGSIHVKPKIESNYLYVRVNGTLMFKEYCSRLKTLVIVELNPATSRENLTSNRDAFNSHSNDMWQQFLEELRKDEKSATAEEANQIEEVCGSGTFEHVKGGSSVVLTEDWFAAAPDEDAEHSSYGNVQAVVINPIAHLVGVNGAGPSYRNDSFQLPSVVPGTGVPNDAPVVMGDLKTLPKSRPVDKRLRNKLFSIIVNNNTACIIDDELKRRTRKAMKSYHPDNWRVIRREGQGTTVTGGGKAKVLLMWKTICHYVVDEFLNEREIENIKWGCGWLFGPDTAEAREHNNVKYLLLNPLNNDAQLHWSLRKSDHLHRMLVLAVHQVAHWHETRHDEDFIIMSEKLMARVLGRIGEIKKAVRRVSRLKLA